MKRFEKKNKYRRWCIYFPKENEKQVRSWKTTLRDVISKSRLKAWQFHDTAPHSADILRVGHAVSYDSAARIIRLATERDHTFQILGQPNGRSETLFARGRSHRTETVSRTAEEQALRTEGTAASPPEARPPRKIARRLNSKAKHVDDASATAASAKATSAKAGTKFTCLPRRLLPLKLEGLCAANRAKATPESNVCVDWNAPSLGEGSFGIVRLGYERGSGGQNGKSEAVAVKVYRAEDGEAGAREEVLCHATLPTSPYILQLQDVALLPSSAGPVFATVYELYDISLGDFLKKHPLTMAGKRHVLKSVVQGLESLHSHAVVHADLKPANILLRGRTCVWTNMFGSHAAAMNAGWDHKEDVQEMEALINHLPTTFQVRSISKVFKQISGLVTTSRSNVCMGQPPWLEHPVLTMSIRIHTFQRAVVTTDSDRLC